MCREATHMPLQPQLIRRERNEFKWNIWIHFSKLERINWEQENWFGSILNSMWTAAMLLCRKCHTNRITAVSVTNICDQSWNSSNDCIIHRLHLNARPLCNAHCINEISDDKLFNWFDHRFRLNFDTVSVGTNNNADIVCSMIPFRCTSFNWNIRLKFPYRKWNSR